MLAVIDRQYRQLAVQEICRQWEKLHKGHADHVTGPLYTTTYSTGNTQNHQTTHVTGSTLRCIAPNIFLYYTKSIKKYTRFRLFKDMLTHDVTMTKKKKNSTRLVLCLHSSEFQFVPVSCQCHLYSCEDTAVSRAAKLLGSASVTG